MTSDDLRNVEWKLDDAFPIEARPDAALVEVGKFRFFFEVVPELVAEVRSLKALLENMTRQRDAFSKGKKAVMGARIDDKRALEAADLLSNAAQALLHVGVTVSEGTTAAALAPRRLQETMVAYATARTTPRLGT